MVNSPLSDKAFADIFSQSVVQLSFDCCFLKWSAQKIQNGRPRVVSPKPCEATARLPSGDLSQHVPASELCCRLAALTPLILYLQVNVTVDYIRPASPATETVPAFSERTCATVTIGGMWVFWPTGTQPDLQVVLSHVSPFFSPWFAFCCS